MYKVIQMFCVHWDVVSTVYKHVLTARATLFPREINYRNNLMLTVWPVVNHSVWIFVWKLTRHHISLTDLSVIYIAKALPAQQTRYAKPMPIWSWADVGHGGPTINRHRFNVSCLLGNLTEYSNKILTQMLLNKRWKPRYQIVNMGLKGCNRHLAKVAVTPFHFQGDEILTMRSDKLARGQTLIYFK